MKQGAAGRAAARCDLAHTRRHSRLLSVGVLVAGLALPAALVAAESAPRADACLADARCAELNDAARKVSKEGQFDAALVLYQAAYAQRPTPWLLVNIGRIQQRLNQYESAIKTYHKYLQSEDTVPENRTKAQAYLQESEKALAELRRQNSPQLPGHDKPPIYKRWWFWTLVGGATLGAALGIGFGVAARDPDATGLMVYRPFAK